MIEKLLISKKEAMSLLDRADYFIIVSVDLESGIDSTLISNMPGVAVNSLLELTLNRKSHGTDRNFRNGSGS